MAQASSRQVLYSRILTGSGCPIVLYFEFLLFQESLKKRKNGFPACGPARAAMCYKKLI
jgi:hypothetical protein